MKKYFLAISIAALATACMTEQEPVLNNYSYPAEIRARIDKEASSPDTKVYADEGFNVLWNNDDRISLFDRYTFNKEYYFTGETGANAGVFKEVNSEEVVAGNEIDYVYAVYPYNESTKISNSGALTLSLPAVQYYTPDSFGPGANVMVSATSDTNLLFKNLCGYLLLKLYGENVVVSSISIKGNNNEVLSGTAEVIATPGSTPSLSSLTSEESKCLTLSCTSQVALGASADEATLFWLAVPPTTFTKGFTLTVTDIDGNTFEKSTGINYEIERNKTFRMEPLEVIIEKEELFPDPVNLSLNGTANCYIISSAGTYSFSAVKGNTLEPVGNIAGVKVLWETFGSQTTPNEGAIIFPTVQYKAGTNSICFKTSDNFTEGSALIAAYADKECSEGNVLWSWHIWAVKDDLESNLQIYNNNFGGKVGALMDRNLGAVTTDKDSRSYNFSLMYQWGRKDPFLGGVRIQVSDGLVTRDDLTKAESTLSWPSSEKANSPSEFSSLSVSKPTTSLSISEDWNDSEWSGRWSEQKTINDPCPPGYKVADKYLWYNAFGSNGGDEMPYRSTNGFRFYLMSMTSNTEEVYYPYSGVMAPGGFLMYTTGVYPIGACWSSTKGSFLGLSANDGFFTTYGYNVYVSQALKSSAYGAPVRCQKEEYVSTDCPEDNKLYYTTTDKKVLRPRRSIAFGPKMKTNVYYPGEDGSLGQGVITCDGTITKLDVGAAQYSSLSSITIPSSVAVVNGGALEACQNLNSIVALPTTAPYLTGSFTRIDRNGTLSFPKGSDYSAWLSDDALGYFGWNGHNQPDGYTKCPVTGKGLDYSTAICFFLDIEAGTTLKYNMMASDNEGEGGSGTHTLLVKDSDEIVLEKHKYSTPVYNESIIKMYYEQGYICLNFKQAFKGWLCLGDQYELIVHYGNLLDYAKGIHYQTYPNYGGSGLTLNKDSEHWMPASSDFTKIEYYSSALGPQETSEFTYLSYMSNLRYFLPYSVTDESKSYNISFKDFTDEDLRYTIFNAENCSIKVSSGTSIYGHRLSYLNDKYKISFLH